MSSAVETVHLTHLLYGLRLMLARPFTNYASHDALVPLLRPKTVSPLCAVASEPFRHGAGGSCQLGRSFGPRRLPPCSHIVTRGKKTKTTVKLEDLPQGLIPLQPQHSPTATDKSTARDGEDASTAAADEEEGPAYPTVILQARRNMQKFSNCVLLTRVGGFYELYLEHAEEFAPLLNLKVAQKKTSAGPVPMVNILHSRPWRGNSLPLAHPICQLVSDFVA